MAEYLNKGLLLAALNSIRINRNAPHAYYIQTGVDAVRDFIRDLPPSDVQETKYGSWYTPKQKLPSNGACVVILTAHGYYVARYYSDGNIWMDGNGDYWEEDEVLYWIELPKSPNEI